MTLDISLLIVFIGLSAFFSASETAIFSLSDLRLRRMCERNPAAKTVKKLLKKPTRLLSAIVFGNLLVNIGLTAHLTIACDRIFSRNGLAISILLSGSLILFFGEIFPKTLAIYTAEKFSIFSSRILNIICKVFLPLIAFIEAVVERLSSLIIPKPRNKALSDEEFRSVLLLSRKEGQISEAEEDMISNVIEFKDTRASEILTARIDIEGIDSLMNQQDVLRFLREKKHSKFPVYEGSLDNITGILYAKDVFLNRGMDYHKFLRQPLFVPESKGIDDILKALLERKKRMAIVLDGYGGTEGLITVEDIVEEIFGEIYDEFEQPQAPLEKITKNAWRVYGKTALKTLNLEFALKIPEEEDTLAGFLLAQTERIPKAGERISFAAKTASGFQKKNLEFIIERATARRIVSVLLEIK